MGAMMSLCVCLRHSHTHAQLVCVCVCSYLWRSWRTKRPLRQRQGSTDTQLHFKIHWNNRTCAAPSNLLFTCATHLNPPTLIKPSINSNKIIFKLNNGMVFVSEWDFVNPKKYKKISHFSGGTNDPPRQPYCCWRHPKNCSPSPDITKFNPRLTLVSSVLLHNLCSSNSPQSPLSRHLSHPEQLVTKNPFIILQRMVQFQVIHTLCNLLFPSIVIVTITSSITYSHTILKIRSSTTQV